MLCDRIFAYALLFLLLFACLVVADATGKFGEGYSRAFSCRFSRIFSSANHLERRVPVCLLKYLSIYLAATRFIRHAEFSIKDQILFPCLYGSTRGWHQITSLVIRFRKQENVCFARRTPALGARAMFGSSGRIVNLSEMPCDEGYVFHIYFHVAVRVGNWVPSSN